MELFRQPHPRPSQPDPEPRRTIPLIHVYERIDQLEKAMAMGQREHTEMRQRIDRLERQLGVLLAAHTESRTDLAGTQHCEHQNLALRTRRLVEQSIHSFARRYAARCGIFLRHPHRERAPHLVGRLTRLLLAESPSTATEMQRSLQLADDGGHIEARLTGLRSQCSELGDDIRRAGLQHTWDFDFTPGGPLDPARQETWPTCDPVHPVQFVMAPAYVVDGRVYGRQIVYTG
ncbi:hypothetical protein [Streptomyces sp. NPDC002209]|uniref:hypothetical protein n=1 Tax=Streptomyces sp. NPDC002209 TaxID=3364638 RepID=UPI0036959729